MADLLIKGMKMPKNCSYCGLYDIATDWCEAINDEILGFDPLATRFDGCPLVEVPAHGRLIDADELLKRKGDCYDHDGHLLYAVGTGDIMLAPTAIEASEDGEQDGKL